MGIALHARIVVGKGLFGHKEPDRLFSDSAMPHRLSVFDNHRRLTANRIIKHVLSIGIFGLSAPDLSHP